MMRMLLLFFFFSCIISSVTSASVIYKNNNRIKIINNNYVEQESAAFDLTLAYNQLMMSYAAYCPQAQIENWSCYFCTNNSVVKNFQIVATAYNATTNIFGYVGYNGNVGHVIFRGTQSNSLLNWITDMNATHSIPYPPIPNAYVHSGFLNAWHSVRPQIIAGVKTIMDTIKPTTFYFSGHSLGAALSVIAAVEVGLTLSVPITCYNYGEPRVGNEDFAQFFDSHIDVSYRIVNQHDIVPHLPPRTLGFYHIATEVWWKNKTTYIICNGSGEDPNCSDSVKVALSVADHLDYLSVPLSAGPGC